MTTTTTAIEPINKISRAVVTITWLAREARTATNAYNPAKSRRCAQRIARLQAALAARGYQPNGERL